MDDTPGMSEAKGIIRRGWIVEKELEHRGNIGKSEVQFLKGKGIENWNTYRVEWLDEKGRHVSEIKIYARSDSHALKYCRHCNHRLVKVITLEVIIHQEVGVCP